MMLCRRLRKLPIDEKTGKVTMELGGYRNADESSTADYAWDSDCKRKSGCADTICYQKSRILIQDFDMKYQKRRHVRIESSG